MTTPRADLEKLTATKPRELATAAMGAGQLKTAIRGLQTARKTAIEGKDTTALRIARLQMKRIKRRLRKLREAS